MKTCKKLALLTGFLETVLVLFILFGFDLSGEIFKETKNQVLFYVSCTSLIAIAISISMHYWGSEYAKNNISEDIKNK